MTMVHVGAVLSVPYTGPFFWTLVASCLQQAAARLGVRLSKHVAATADDMAARLHELLDAGAQAIVVKPLFDAGRALTAVLDRAERLGVALVTLDSRIDHPAVRATVGSDNHRGMQRVTAHALDCIGGKGTVVYFAGDERLSAGAVRNQAFRQALARYPDVTLLQEERLDWVTVPSRMAFAASCMERVLARHDRFDALVAAGDEAAIGGVNTLREAQSDGRWAGPPPVIVGFNGLAEALLLVRSGEMTATISQSPEWIAQTSLEMALECVRGGRPASALRFVENQLVTRDNVAEHALQFLHVVPLFIAELGESQTRERALQQAVISRQRGALQLMSRASDVLTRFQTPLTMVCDLFGLLRQQFPALDARVVTLDAPLKKGKRAGRRDPAQRGTFAGSWLWRPAADAGAEGCERLPLSAHEEAVYRRCARAAPCSAADGDPAREPLVWCAELNAALFPLQADEAAFGALDIRSPQRRQMDSETVEILGAIAHQLSLALHSAALYEAAAVQVASELQAAQHKLVNAEQAEYLSNHDALTGLPNRRLFRGLIERALNEARRHKRHLAVLFLDLDGFKAVNDTFGHDAGDQLLQQVAGRLKAALRSGDTVARLGGDEFIVLLPDLPDEQRASTFAAKLVDGFDAPFTLQARRLAVTTSVGIALFPGDAGEPAALMAAADAAMYEAKRSGKNRYRRWVRPGADVSDVSDDTVVSRGDSA